MEPEGAIVNTHKVAQSWVREVVSVITDPLGDNFGEDRGLSVGTLLRVRVVIHMEKPLRMVRIEDLMVRDVAGKDDLLSFPFEDIGNHARPGTGDGKGRQARG